MFEVLLIVTGLVFFAWLYALVRQTQRGFGPEQVAPSRPVVPLNLMASDEAVVVAEGHGRIVYANDSARRWFGINGGAPNLTLMAHLVQPSDTLHDLLAGPGHASFRLGQRQIEAVSHSIPATGGQRIVLVMRELSAASVQAYIDYDPLRALAIVGDISEAVGAGLDLNATVDAILRSIQPSVAFDFGELTLWQPATRTLHPVGRGVRRTTTGSLVPISEERDIVYELGEGYSGWIAMYHQPLLIGNVAGRTDVQPKAFQGSYQSYVGVPLSVGDQFIGTLELTHREQNAFGQRDLALLQAIAGHVASAIHAATLYRAQSERVAELDGLQQIAEAMSQLGEMSELYGQLTQRIAGLVGVELCGVLLYDEDKQVFRSQPPFYGVPDSLIRHYRLSVVPGTDLYTIWHHQPWWFTNDPESSLVRAMGFEDLISAITINGLALVPMIVGARRIGLLLVANKRNRQNFTEDDMRALISFAAQAAVVAENARLYHEEQRRAREFGGVQQIAQAIGVLRSPSELYSQITARIAGLLNVQMCGILLYDPKDRVLVSQQPFYGLEDAESVAFYQIPSRPGSPVARLWQTRETWFSNDLRNDPVAGETDLAAMALQVGIRQTAIAALIVGGNRLGVIQASNKADSSGFTDDDVRLLSIFAGQAAILIDNARLYREMQRRTHEAEGLRAVTEIASQAVPDAETVESVLIAISNLLETNVVAMALVEEGTGQLVIAPGNVWGAPLAEPYRIDTYSAGFEQSALVSRRPFVSNDLRGGQRLLHQYQPLADRLSLRNCIQAPLVIQEHSVGELLVANRTSGEPYTDADVQLLVAIATQVAAMVDRMRMYQATDQDLRARVQELSALSRVSHELSLTLELERILDVIRQEALRSTEASAASIVLLIHRDDWPAPDQPQIEQRYGEGRVLRDLAPVERAAVLRNDVLIVDDYRASDLKARPDKARSALVVPITFGEQVIGLIHLYSTAPGSFDQRVVNFVVSLTDQASVAIGNARRYREQLDANQALRIRAERMGRIFELGEMFRQGASLGEMLEEVAHSIQETVGYNVVLISLVDERAGVLRRTAQAGLPLAIFQEIQAITPPVDQARSLMQEQYHLSNSYFLPAESSEDLMAGLPVVQVSQERTGNGGPRAWHPDDLLLVPLYGSGGRWLGLISVDEPLSGRRPDLATVEALEIFASQASFAIENYRLVERIQQEARATRHERDRLAQLHMVASEIQRSQDVPSRLQVVADGIHDAGWGHVVITLRDEHLEPTALIQTGYTTDEALRLSDEVLPGETWRAWINDLDFYELKLGAGYYMRYNHPWVRKNVLKGREPEPSSVSDDVWHPQDVLYLPLVGQDQKRIIGIISMDSPTDGRVPTEASLQPFELFASQAAAAIETTRLYQETVRAADQEQRLNEVMEAVSASISPDGVIRAIGHGLQQMVPLTRMSVAIFNEGMDRFDVLRADIALDSTVVVQPDQPMETNNTATGLAYREGKARLYQLGRDEAARENFVDLGAWHHSGERSTLLVPMTAGGQPVGTLHLGSELENAFGFRENLELIQRLANLSAVALENARLFEQVRQRATELDIQASRLAVINRVAARLSQALTPEEIYQIALSELREVLGAQHGSVIT
ncbi:MAG TPA: GAF domain-containing protein, partial [Aggregatilineaceae bacterium]|nr:GAF domain-containing protein [Aggregatilineaceae bacterium]